MLSLWRDNVCAGSFRLAVDEVPDLIALLRAGLDQAYDVALATPRTAPSRLTGLTRSPLADAVGVDRVAAREI